MENVLLDRRSSSGSFELPRMSAGRYRRGLGAKPATPRGAYNYNRSFPTCPPYMMAQPHKGGWSSAPAFPYARPPPIYSSQSLPLLPSNQPPLLPLPPTATIKYATFPCLPAQAPPPPPPSRAVMGAAATATTVPAAAAPAPPRQRDRRRRPARPPPPSTTTEPAKTQMKKPLQRATPLPPAPVVTGALDDLEREVARNFVQDLLHALAPPPSSLPLPRFSVVRGDRAVAPAAPSCNAEAAAAADGIRGLLRL